MKKHTERGFTLMELMVVIVIVAILAAVAVPLYINYVKDAQRTEAKGAIGAIISAEQVFYQKSALSAGAATYAPTLDDLKAAHDVDLTEPEAKWTFIATGTADGFHIVATNNADNTLKVTYDFSRTVGDPNAGGKFTDD